MTDWVCPDCGGGFPTPHEASDRYGRPDGLACPWCGNEIDAGSSDE